MDAQRIPPQRLIEITGKRRPSAQTRWFQTHYGVALPCDHAGPVITATTFEQLVQVKCGLLATSPTIAAEQRPKLIPKKSRHATPKKPKVID